MRFKSSLSKVKKRNKKNIQTKKDQEGKKKTHCTIFKLFTKQGTVLTSYMSKLYVKWKGYKKSFNSWIDKTLYKDIV